MITVVMIGGKSHNGKGSVARYIMENSNSRYNKIQSSLSEYIRRIAKDDFFWDGEDTDESREFMGEVYRLGSKLYPYHMSRRVWERDNKPFIVEDADNLIIVESLREKDNYDFYNMLLEFGKIDRLFTIRVERPEFDDLEDEERKAHVSEVDLDDFEFDHYILNDTCLYNLELNTIKTMKKLRLL